MNKKNYNPKYKKVHNNNSNNISHTTRNQRDLYISKIMDKYGLDDLLNATLKCIKSSEANNIYNVIRDKYK